jgi:hypothetical protein
MGIELSVVSCQLSVKRFNAKSQRRKDAKGLLPLLLLVLVVVVVVV